MKQKAAIGILLLFGIGHHAAFTQEITRQQIRIDWTTGLLEAVYTVRADIQGKNRLSALPRTQSITLPRIMEEVPALLTGLQVDSRHTLESLLETDPRLRQELSRRFNLESQVQTAPGRDLGSLGATIRCQIIPLLYSLLDKSRFQIPLARVFSWQAETPYTGIIIYAKEQLDWYGEGEYRFCVPALFPRLHNSRGQQIYSVENVQPDMARKWGNASYCFRVDDPGIRDRVGTKPLVIPASGVFGTIPTDLVISEEDSTLLLFNKTTRRALEEGRLAIILSPEVLVYTP